MKNIIAPVFILLFAISVQGQTHEKKFKPLNYNSPLMINSLIISSFSNQLDNANEFKKWSLSDTDANNANSNNPYLSPLQMVNNVSTWCPQQAFQTSYFVDRVMFKTYKIGNLKMHANYVYDMQGNLRSTSTSFGD